MAESLAGLARVAYETTGLSEFRADNNAAERAYRDATGGMSDAAIKLELAQERLRRSLAKGPSASRESARALLAVRQAERDLAVQSDRTTRELQQQERTLSRLSRGAVAGSGIFHGLGRSIAFASGTFLGGAGLIYALRSTLEAGREAEASQGRVAVAVRNSGLEYGRYRDQIDRTITKQSELSAFDDEDLADSFAKLVIRTKDVNEALRLNALVADVARGRNISLEAATQLVIKASLNQAGQLRRVGIEVGKNTTAQELLNKLTASYSGQAERYGREGAGAQERLGVAIENTEETISKGLLPTVTRLSNGLADWLSDSRNQERIQRDVNEAVKAGTGIVKGLAAGLGAVKRVAEPVVNALGGIEHATELAFGAALLLKIRRAAGSMGLIATSSAATSAKGIADAAAFGRAWDVATRPRSLIVNTPVSPGVPGGVPAGAPTTTGGRGRFGRRRGVADRINDFGNPPAPRTGPQIPGGNIAGFILSGIAFTQSGEQQQAQAAYDPRTDTFHLVLNGRELMQIPEDVARKSDPALYAKVLRYRLSLSGPRPDEGTRGAITNRATPRRPRTTTGGRGTSTTAPTPRTLLDIQTDLARARTTAGTSDDQRFLTEERNLLRSRIAFLEGRKNLTDKSKQELQRLYGELGQAQSQLDGFAEAREQALDDARERRHKQAVAAQKRRTARAKARQEALLRQRLEDARSLSIGAKKEVSSRFPLGEDRLKRIDPEDLKKPDTADDKIDDLRQELGSLFRDFMTWQVDLLRNGSNVMGGNLSSSMMEQLMMSGNLERTRQTRAIEKLAAGTGPRRHLDDAVMGW